MKLPDDVVLLCKKDSTLMRLVGLVIGDHFMKRFWTTYRLPFGRPVIAHPVGLLHPERHADILEHELYHVKQLRPWYGPLVLGLGATLLPLPVLLSGRWFIERHAYLNDIRHGRWTVNEAVEALWNGYGWPWPKAWMKRWFERQLLLEP